MKLKSLKILIITLIATLTFGAIGFAVAGISCNFADLYKAEAVDTVEIGNFTQLQNFISQVNNSSGALVIINAKLTADINCGGNNFTEGIGKSDSKMYGGTFDGNGHKIYNFNKKSGQRVALFGYIYQAQILDLRVSDFIIERQSPLGMVYYGGLVDVMCHGSIVQRCMVDNFSIHLTGNTQFMTAGWIGGIVGRSYEYSDSDASNYLLNCYVKLWNIQYPYNDGNAIDIDRRLAKGTLIGWRAETEVYFCVEYRHPAGSLIGVDIYGSTDNKVSMHIYRQPQYDENKNFYQNLDKSSDGGINGTIWYVNDAYSEYINIKEEFAYDEDSTAWYNEYYRSAFLRQFVFSQEKTYTIKNSPSGAGQTIAVPDDYEYSLSSPNDSSVNSVTVLGTQVSLNYDSSQYEFLGWQQNDTIITAQFKSKTVINVVVDSQTATSTLTGSQVTVWPGAKIEISFSVSSCSIVVKDADNSTLFSYSIVPKEDKYYLSKYNTSGCKNGAGDHTSGETITISEEDSVITLTISCILKQYSISFE